MVKNDKGNHRPKGKTLPRQMKGLDTTTRKCSHMFDVSSDNSGYFVYLSGHSGIPYHHDHSQIFNLKNIPMNIKYLSERRLESISNVVESTCNKASGRNFIFTRFRKGVSQWKLSFLHRNLLSEV